MRPFSLLIPMIAGVVLLGGCSGHVAYTPPTVPQTLKNSVVINKARERAWNALVPELGKQFFVINNMDKSSGFINISYSGSPEQYVDCGTVTSYVKNARGERNYIFPGASAYQKYELLNSSGLYFVERKMSLEGRINLIFEEVEGEQTRITANTKYLLTREQHIQEVAGRTGNLSHVIQFNTGQAGSFPHPGDGEALQCRSTGKLEHDILALLKP